MDTKMLIVGAGIAGLATGYYARLNGFDATIFEAHSEPGGLCAAWTRKGYTFDTSMHMVTSSKGGPFQPMWRELGVVGERSFHYHAAMYTIEGRDKKLTLSIDGPTLRRDLLALSPGDAPLIDEFVKLFCGPGVMGMAGLKPAELSGPFDSLKTMVGILPLIPTFRRYGKTTVQEFAARFQDPFLRDAIRFVIDSPGWPMPRFPMAALVGFGQSSVGDAGVPIGGSNRAINDLAERYRKLGGAFRFRSRIAGLLVEQNRAVGVRLESGEEVRGDLVVWAGDGHHLIFDLLEGRYLDERIRRMYAEWTPVLPMVQVTLGVNRDLSKEPARLIRELKEPIEIAGEQHRWITVVNHAFDPTTAPAGKSAIEVWFATQFEPWKRLAADPKRYEAEKARIAERSIEALEERWPGIRAQIEVNEVATPMTYVRYTGNWQGSPDGWYVTVDNFMERSMLRSLPGLDGLYTVGQWTAPFTGTVMAALSGRQLVELLCRRAKRRFVTCPA